MNGRRPAIVLCLCLCCVLAACRAPSPQGSAGDGTAPIESPAASPKTSQSVQSLPPAPKAEASILQYGENILNRATIDELVSLYGPYNKAETAYYSGTGHTYLRLAFDGLVVSLVDLGEPLSFVPKDGDEGFEFGEKENALSEADQKLELKALKLMWSNPDVLGPRRTKIGDRVDAVRAKFMDKSAVYGDGTTIYKLTDEILGYTGGQEGRVGGTLKPWEGEWETALPVSADQVLEYSAYGGEDAYQYTRYYLTGGVVTAIEQGGSDIQDTP